MKMTTTQPSPTASVERLALSPNEAAQSLGLSRETIYRLLARGKLRAVPGIRHKVIPRSELKRFIESAQVNPTRKA